MSLKYYPMNMRISNHHDVPTISSGDSEEEKVIRTHSYNSENEDKNNLLKFELLKKKSSKIRSEKSKFATFDHLKAERKSE